MLAHRRQVYHPDIRVGLRGGEGPRRSGCTGAPVRRRWRRRDRRHLGGPGSHGRGAARSVGRRRQGCFVQLRRAGLPGCRPHSPRERGRNARRNASRRAPRPRSSHVCRRSCSGFAGPRNGLGRSCVLTWLRFGLAAPRDFDAICETTIGSATRQIVRYPHADRAEAARTGQTADRVALVPVHRATRLTSRQGSTRFPPD